MPYVATSFRSGALYCLAISLLILGVICRANGQASNGDGSRTDLSIGRITFSCPSGFVPQSLPTRYQVVYMRHERDDLALFVTTPQPGAGDEYVEHLGTFLASSLYPQEWAVFAWKRLGGPERDGRIDAEVKPQAGGGVLSGFNGAQAVVLSYKRLRVNGADIIAGYLTGAGRDEYGAGARGQASEPVSQPGRQALEQLIGSIRGSR